MPVSSMLSSMEKSKPSACDRDAWSGDCRRGRPEHCARCRRATSSKHVLRSVMAKVACIGGGGVRTPLVIFGVNECGRRLGIDEIVLFDAAPERAQMMAALGQAVVRREGGSLRVRQTSRIEDAVEGADFVLNSIRVGGIAARASDEGVAIAHGYPGQETTGPAGMAMALRTVPIAVEQARLVSRLAPHGWLINFTNPAGLI